MYPVPPLTPLAQGLPATIPFVGPEALERDNGRPLQVRLGANESAFGISPKARQAMIAGIDHLAWYNDPEGHDLRTELARRHGTTIDQVGLGAGIDELLGLLVRLYAEPGTSVVSSLGAYPTFNYHVHGFGAQLHTVPYREDLEDLEGLLATAHRHQPRLLYLANPDNPMGTWHPATDVAALRDRLPAHCLLILDEAYSEFAPQEARLAPDLDDPRCIHMRTFSKAHGMAGARIGYALGHHSVIAALNKVRNHFGVNRLAQVGALASLQDTDFIAAVVEAVAQGREDYYQLAAELGLRALPSATNFVALDLGGNGDRARAALAALLDLDVFVRMPGVAPLDRCIRVTVGTPPERAALAQALRQVVAQLPPLPHSAPSS
ncbi:MAG: aminotransferase class I/II-fold pyridoxal phosphate-dependent enzyme [Candidatus Latescibacteria bacterium]|nr:aminotransferase class I/II-fold pyridoxal phosphate-dependent enzyme [Candidatus Latescibacterota bacterium]